ncbi:phosphatidate cytidylyltransferase [Microbulbifer flavimaris]|uniref:Phosphatidate cytidylyltransferase n=1 Tax=Microbulbifer flavimaris TaxID=1781068 RepID=A0ABX4I5D6_9GAMM|nr:MULTISPECIES: phosphatidate cytidylyltransferase [Microbulbifer]KUJ84979.1 phosphatidate cytidylyltransferase [Microbulbifer sp. ZGT114]PCO07075.1 phosphatidate cytidylyltransferase [Microbulbifer flavimaris]
MLKQRIITALVLVALFLGALFFLPIQWFTVATVVVILLGGWEWANLSNLNRALRFVFLAALGAALIGVAQYVFAMDFANPDTSRAQEVLAVACGWWALAFLWVQSYPASAMLWGNRWVRGLIGLVVLVPAWLSMVILRGQDHGAWLVLFVVAVVVAADVGAYFVGRRYGKHKLAREVSPGKSWEGFFGGLGACLILAIGVSFALSLPLKNSLLFSFGILVTAVASVIGDLVESMLKRHRGIKDSSHMLPGHGGILDRLDSLSAALPVFTMAALASELPKYL